MNDKLFLMDLGRSMNKPDKFFQKTKKQLPACFEHIFFALQKQFNKLS